jgi:hypothetical protein
MLQNLYGGLSNRRREVVIEGVGPKDHLRFALIPHASAREPLLESFGSKRRNMTLLRISRGEFRQITQAGRLRKEVGECGHSGDQLATGQSNKEIGEKLEITEHTVKAHVKSILVKLGAIGRTEAIAIATKRGLIRER